MQAHGAGSFLPLARSGRRFLGTGACHDPATTAENMSSFSRLLCRKENSPESEARRRRDIFRESSVSSVTLAWARSLALAMAPRRCARFSARFASAAATSSTSKKGLPPGDRLLALADCARGPTVRALRFALGAKFDTARRRDRPADGETDRACPRRRARTRASSTPLAATNAEATRLASVAASAGSAADVRLVAPPELADIRNISAHRRSSPTRRPSWPDPPARALAPPPRRRRASSSG